MDEEARRPLRVGKECGSVYARSDLAKMGSHPPALARGDHRQADHWGSGAFAGLQVAPVFGIAGATKREQTSAGDFSSRLTAQPATATTHEVDISIPELPGWRGRDDRRASNDFDQRIARNPLNRHAGAGWSFPRAEIRPVDFIQRIILRFMGIEPRFTCRHRDRIGVRKADKDLCVDDAVHRAAGALQRFLKRIHGSSYVLLEWVRDQNVIVLGVAVIGAGTREVIDSIVCVVAAARLAPGGRGRCRGSGWRLLSEKNRCARHGGHHCREFIEVPASSIDVHKQTPPLMVMVEELIPWNTFTICKT